MRKILTFVAAMFITSGLFAGGLVTNTNQSAMFTRLQNRNASTGIDAVYYNPAGLIKLGDGFFFSLNNQSIGQTKTVGNNYSYLTGTKPKDYVGDVSAPIYPGAYVAYNLGNLSFSVGFNPIGGGGGAKYNKGLPSFEMGIADIVPSLASQGIPTTGYSADIFFEGTSVYMGYQANIGYKINEKLSVAAGLRMVSASNTYNGYLKNISINSNYPAFGTNFTGGMVKAKDFFTAGATTLTSLASGASQFVAGLQPIVTAGAGATPLANGTAVGLNATQISQIQQILGATGLMTPAQIGAVSIAAAQGTLAAAGPAFTSKAAIMTANAGKTTDIDVDAAESGTGYTPIISVNYSPSENLNISLRYEFKTKLELTTKVNANKGGGIFIDGTKKIADMPAMLAIGAEFKPMKKLMIAATFNTYFDKNVDYDGSSTTNINMIDKNFLEYGLGLEYSLTEKLRASAGWVATSTGVNDAYQNDQEYSTNTNSFGGGFGYRISPMIDVNVGAQYTFYKEGTKTFDHMLGTVAVPTTETYNKKTWVYAAGIDLYFGKK